jgi:hypothetical protein
LRIFGGRIEIGASTSRILVNEVILGQRLRDFCCTKRKGKSSSRFLLDDVRVGLALRDFRLTKWEWSMLFEIYGGRSETEEGSSRFFGRSGSGAATSGFLVDDVEVVHAFEDILSTI